MIQIQVLLVDDHAMLRAGIRQFLEKDPAIRVVAEAGNGKLAQPLVARHQPDVIVLDIKMPEMNGVEFTKWLKAHQPDSRILILSAFDDDPYVLATLRAGANGYVLKTASPVELAAAVKKVYAGQSALDPAVAQKAMMGMMGGNSAEISLTHREHDVLQAAASGLTNREIGEQLAISDRTVQAHLAKVYRKLDVNTRTEAVTAALAHGLLDLPAA